jgi:UPF0755 protein
MLKSLYKFCFTGCIALLALGGYCVYCLLWMGRLIMKKFQFVITVVLLALLLAAGSAAWLFNYYFMPVKRSGAEETVQLTIERGTSARAVADTLESLGVVRSGKMFYYWLRYTETAIQAGRFTFVKGEGAVNAAEKLLKAEIVERTVIVLEGLTMEQAAGKVAAQTGIDSAEFVRLCRDSAFIASVGVSAKTLEGYLFPDTYRFPEQVTADAVVRRMTARFNEALAGVVWNADIKAKYSLHEVLTLASIVEKEATLPSERGRIAGVFHNRLKKGWPLGADPTVRYIFRKFDGPLYVSELNSDSPYNTRRFVGLPPGPICAPGLGAIQAGAKPDSTDDMFFVALWDGSGAHDFSVTNAEHDRKKLKIREENELRVKKNAKRKGKE